MIPLPENGQLPTPDPGKVRVYVACIDEHGAAHTVQTDVTAKEWATLSPKRMLRDVLVPAYSELRAHC